MFRPDLIEYNKLTKANPLQSLNNAFNVADQKLGLTPLLDAEGKIDCIMCNEKFSVVSYLVAWGLHSVHNIVCRCQSAY